MRPVYNRYDRQSVNVFECTNSNHLRVFIARITFDEWMARGLLPLLLRALLTALRVLTVQPARGVLEKENGKTWGEMIEDNDCEKRDKSCFTRLFETYCDEHKCLAFCYVRQIFVKSRRQKNI